jgi:hypothetical protein
VRFSAFSDCAQGRRVAEVGFGRFRLNRAGVGAIDALCLLTGTMPETPIALRVPAACPKCGRSGHVHLQQTIRADQITLQWQCGACAEEWPVRRKEEVASVGPD